MLKVLDKIKAIHVISLGLIGVIIFLLFRVNGLQNSIEHIARTSDTLVTYINKLDQRVYEIPHAEIDPQLIKAYSKIDSSYAVLYKRIEALNRNHKDLQSSVTFALSHKDTATVTNISNTYVATDSDGKEVLYKTFDFNDGLLKLESRVNSNLDNIYHDYEVKIDKMSLDIFKNRRGFSAIATFDNPNLKLDSYNVFIKSQPKPKYVLSAGIGFGTQYDLSSKKLGYGPNISILFGKPILTIYK